MTTGTISHLRSSAQSQSSRARPHEEVREHEDEGAGREVAPLLDQVPQAARDRALRRAERAIEVEPADLALAARRVPVRLGLALVVVAEEAAGGDGAVADQAHRLPDRRRLVQPRPLLAEERHRRPAVGEDDDARRLLREVLADDELVGPAGEGEAGRGGPVDLADVVARPVRARGGDVRAVAAADAVQAAEREPEHAAPGNERKGRAQARSGSPRPRARHPASAPAPGTAHGDPQRLRPSRSRARSRRSSG